LPNFPYSAIWEEKGGKTPKRFGKPLPKGKRRKFLKGPPIRKEASWGKIKENFFTPLQEKREKCVSPPSKKGGKKERKRKALHFPLNTEEGKGEKKKFAPETQT